MMILILMMMIDDVVDDVCVCRWDDEYDCGCWVVVNDGWCVVMVMGLYDCVWVVVWFGGGGDEGATRANANAVSDLVNLL